MTSALRYAAFWLLMVASPAGFALPALRLALSGDAVELPLGATSPFRDARLEALALERPMLLDTFEAAFARFAADAESTLAIGGDHRYAGTSASDFRSRLTLVKPFELFDRRVVAALSGRFETGSLVVHHRTEGRLVAIDERRAAPQAGLSVRLTPWLRAGVSGGLGAARGYAVEVAATAGPLELGVVRRREHLSFDVDAPAGPTKRRLRRPALAYDIEQTRDEALAVATLSTRWLDLHASWDALHPEDHVLDGAMKPLPWLSLRGHYSTARWRFDDWATNDGELVARVDLGIRTRTWGAGIEATFGDHVVALRTASTSFSTASAWQDNGAVTARKFFELDADFDLYMRHVYLAAFDRWGAGWRGRFGAVSLSAGLQHLAADSGRGGAVYGSAVTAALSGREEVLPAFLRAVGLTAGIEWRRGPLLLRLALAQIVPYSAQEERPPPTGSDPGPTGPAKERTWAERWEKVQKAMDTFDGGRLLALELVHRL